MDFKCGVSFFLPAKSPLRDYHIKDSNSFRARTANVQVVHSAQKYNLRTTDYFYIQSCKTEYVVPGRSLSVRACVCVSVCLSVVVSKFHNFLPILLKLGSHSLNKSLRWHFSQILNMLLWWRHNGFFAVFQCGTLTF